MIKADGGDSWTCKRQVPNADNDTDDTWQMTHMTHMTQMTYRWHRHMIVDFFQVMPFQLGCVHCAGVILPAGLFLLFLSLKTDKKQFKPVAKRQEFRLKLVQCCPLISSVPTDKNFLFILIFSFFRFPLYRVERGLDQRMRGAGFFCWNIFLFHGAGGSINWGY